MPMVDLGPSPAFEKVIESIDGFSERVEEPAELPGALQRALDAVAGGVPALLNVITRGG